MAKLCKWNSHFTPTVAARFRSLIMPYRRLEIANTKVGTLAKALNYCCAQWKTIMHMTENKKIPMFKVVMNLKDELCCA